MCAGMKEGRKQGKQAGNYTTRPMCAGRKEGSKEASRQGTQAGKRNSMAEYAFPHITNLSMLFTKK
jgi:hypothetical protein